METGYRNQLQIEKNATWGKPVSLFNGKDLTGWKMSDPNAAAVWKVENGTLVSPGRGPEIINEQKFQDLKPRNHGRSSR